jgi:hypothetical protein
VCVPYRQQGTFGRDKIKARSIKIITISIKLHAQEEITTNNRA